VSTFPNSSLARLWGNQRHAWRIATMANSLVAETKSSLAVVVGNRIPRSHRILSMDNSCENAMLIGVQFCAPIDSVTINVLYAPNERSIDALFGSPQI
jgi:hypothetical protein